MSRLANDPRRVWTGLAYKDGWTEIGTTLNAGNCAEAKEENKVGKASNLVDLGVSLHHHPIRRGGVHMPFKVFVFNSKARIGVITPLCAIPQWTSLDPTVQ